MADNAQSSHLIPPTSSRDNGNHCAGEIRTCLRVAAFVDDEIE